MSNKEKSKSKKTPPRGRREDEEGAEHSKPKVALDGGTLNVARGKTAKELKAESKKAAEQLRKTPGAAKHFVDEDMKERLGRLKEDDKAPNLDRLNEKQKRAYEKRRNRRADLATQARLKVLETRRMQAAVQAAQAAELLETAETGMIEVEHEMERTTALTQQQLKRDHLDKDTARHIFQLDLNATAPYGMKYDRSGRYSVLYGHTGHLALMDNHLQSLETEFNVQERVRDACFLHNYSMFAAAQKNHVFIYDHKGTEIHRLSDHTDPMALEFLPYHWLLASIGRHGWLRYRDTSTGEAVSTHRTQLGPCSVLRQNPINAVIHAGHGNGTVTLWSPASSRYLAKIRCHKGAAVHSIAISPDGKTMVTGGADRLVRVWDLRMFTERHKYVAVPGIPSSLDISQNGLLAVGHAGHATIWSAQALEIRAKDPYMHHSMPRCSPVETIRFRPFEDVCGIGHARGIDSIVVPGSGAAQLDTTEYHLNPAADSKQRQESEVRALLDK